MGMPNQVDRLARLSLVAALGLAVFGRLLHETGTAPFWGGLLFAFGEAALVGGLADWFAVRALFVHPFGIPFPHTALIPRNRPRIIREIRELVQNEWLPRSLLTAKVEAFDFVGDGLLPIVGPLKSHLREVIRSVARDVLDETSPHALAGFLGRGLAGSIDADRVGPFLADLANRAREQRWLQPLLHEWVKRLEAWASSAQSRETIRLRLQQIAEAYRERGWFKKFTYRVAEFFGGVDLNHLAILIQAEAQRFISEQLADESQMHQVVRDGLANIGARLRQDPEFLGEVRAFILRSTDTGALTSLLEPVLSSLREEGKRELADPESRLVAAAMGHLDGWLHRLEHDRELRDLVNAWCRRLVGTIVEENHSLIGTLVEEQLNRLSDQKLTELIEAKVGEDLNWIRINGSLVGGLVGLLLYLSFNLVTMRVPRQ
jgi:uncharacterized membrane-anchored protein YjiN (DUF445 family)